MVTASPRAFGRTFASLRERNFCLFWSGQLVSATGTWMYGIGQAWLVLQLTHSALQLGVVGALQALPVLFLTLAGGVLADRVPRRKILLMTQSAAMLQSLALWILTGTGQIHLWEVYLLALLLGLTNSIDTPTRHAFVAELVDRANLTNAMSLNAVLANTARIVGPSLGGVIIAAAGVTDLFLLNTLSYLAVLAALLLIRPRPGSGARESGGWESLRTGLSSIRETPVMLWSIAVVGIILLFGSNFNVLLPLFATDVLHLGAAGFGTLTAAFGLGSIAAGMSLAWAHARPTPRRILLGTLAFGLAQVAFAFSHLPALSLLLIAGVGAAEESFATLAISLIQGLAPGHLRGRITGVYILVFNGSVPIGYTLTGFLAARLGAPTAMLLLAAMCLAATGVGRVWSDAAGLGTTPGGMRG